jgi:hypothetical protein
LRISSIIIGFCQVQKRNEERKECKEKEKKRKEVRGDQHIKVVKIRSLNQNLDLLWKDFGMKLEDIIEDYKMVLFSNFQKKRICFVRVMSFWKLCARSSFLVISCLFVWAFLDLQLWDLIDHKGLYMWEKFKSFGYVLREIQVSKISISILKSVYFENDNSLWSSSIELKFWEDI